MCLEPVVGNIKILVSERMDNQVVIYSYQVTLLSNKGTEATDSHN